MLPACQEPWATGLEGLSRGCHRSRAPRLHHPVPSPAPHRDTHVCPGPSGGLCMTHVLACLARTDPRRGALCSLGPVGGARTHGHSSGAALVSAPPQAPGLPASGTSWVRRGDERLHPSPDGRAQPSRAAPAVQAGSAWSPAPGGWYQAPSISHPSSVILQFATSKPQNLTLNDPPMSELYAEPCGVGSQAQDPQDTHESLCAEKSWGALSAYPLEKLTAALSKQDEV